jgi:hypothetical protein
MSRDRPGWTTQRTPITKVAWASGLLVVLWLVLASTALAGEWHQYACRAPSGAVSATNTCASAGSLDVRVDGSVSHPANNDVATFAYAAPANTTLAAATLYRFGLAFGSSFGAGGLSWLNATNDTFGPGTFDACSQAEHCEHRGTQSSPLSWANRVVVPSAFISEARNIYVNASCSGVSGSSCAPLGFSAPLAETSLYAADLTIEDDNTPSVSNVSGPLASAAALSGQQDVSFNAADSGGGIYAAQVFVDGRQVDSQVLDSNGGRCVDVGQTSDGTHAFMYRNPCKAAVSSDLVFDTSKVPDGPHQIAVKVADAAQDTSYVVAPRTVTISNAAAGALAPEARGASNGTAASDQAAFQLRSKTRLTAAFSRSAFHVTGRLVNPAGQPIAQAQVDVLAQAALTGAPLTELTRFTTGPQGTFDVLIPAGPSRMVVLGYRSHARDIAFAATAAISQRVRVAVQLHVTPRQTGPHGVIRLRGRVLGGFIPHTGKVVELLVHYLGSWRVFQTVRTKPNGTFSSVYQFLGARGTFPFRARVRGEDPSYPYDDGLSPARNVRTG